MITVGSSHPSNPAIARPFYLTMSLLLAAIVIAGPGFERSLPVFNFGPHWYLVIDALVIGTAFLGPAVDLATHRRIHPAIFTASLPSYAARHSPIGSPPPPS